MKDPVFLKNLIRQDHGYRFLKQVRGTPSYWQTVFLDLVAMVRQLGIPTWFLTLSAADLRWPEVIFSIARQYGQSFTDDDIEKMSWEEKCTWIRNNPVTCARHFDHRLNVFLKKVIFGPGEPIGKITDHMYRIEFQARGSPHAHILLWVADAPFLDNNTDIEVTDFIDRYVSGRIPRDGALQKLVVGLQSHAHSKVCRRHGRCRFSFPKPPSIKTVIAREPTTPKDKTGHQGEEHEQFESSQEFYSIC